MGIDPISWIVIAVVAIAGAVAYSGYQSAKKAAQSALERSRGMVYQVRASAYPRRIIYGERRVGGLEVYVATSGTNNEYLHYIFYWGEGPCKSVKKILFDGVEVPLDANGDATGNYAGLVHVESKLGDSGNNTAIAGAVSAGIGWATTDKMLGCCYSWVRVKHDQDKFATGMPNISAVIEGRNDIFDTRTDTTGYSTNVALCFDHYLTLSRFGPEVDSATEVDEDTLIEAANVCDELVSLSTGGTEKRYTFNGIFSLEDETESVIERFRTAMAGAAVYAGGKWRMYAGAYVSPTFTIGEDMLVGPVKLSTKTSKKDHVNTIKGVYISEASNWQPTDFPAYVNSTYVTEDGQELPDDINLDDTNSPSMARRIAKINCESQRRSRTVQIQCNIEALRAMPGRPVIFHFPRQLFNNQPMMVLEYGMSIIDNKIVINLTLREIDPAIYAWDSSEDKLNEIVFGAAPTLGEPPPETVNGEDIVGDVGLVNYNQLF